MSIEYKGKYGRPLQDLKYNDSLSNIFLNSCVGITADKNNNYWVADTGNSRVLIFNNSFTKIIGVLDDNIFKNPKSYPTKIKKLNLPFRFSNHPVIDKKIMFLTDTANHRVLALDYSTIPLDMYSDFNKKSNVFLSYTFGSHGYGKNQFNGPNGITSIQKDGKVLILVADEFAYDENFGQIKVFDENGNELWSIDGVKTTPMDNIWWPQGILIDYDFNTNEHYLYITDPYHFRVVRTDLEGNPKPFSNGNYYLSVKGAMGLRTVKILNDIIYIFDNSSGTVHLFNKAGEFLQYYLLGYGAIDMVVSMNSNSVYVTHAGYPAVFERNINDLSQVIAKTIGEVRLPPMFSGATSVSKGLDENLLYNLDMTIPSILSQMPNMRCQVWKKSNLTYDNQTIEFNNNILTGLPTIILSTSMIFFDNYFFITDFFSNIVYILDTNLNSIKGIIGGSNLPPNDQFLNPKGIAVINHPIKDDYYRVFVVDSRKSRICIWDCDKKFSSSSIKTHRYDLTATSPELCLPMDVAVHKSNTVFVTDQFNNRVVVFGYNPEKDVYTEINEFGSIGYKADEMGLPSGIMVFDDYLFTVDLINRAIKCFKVGDYSKLYDIYPKVPLGYYPQSLGSNPGEMWMPSSISEIDLKSGKITISDLALNINHIFFSSCIKKAWWSNFFQTLKKLFRKKIKSQGKEGFMTEKEKRQLKEQLQKSLLNFSKDIYEHHTKEIYSNHEYEHLQSEYYELIGKLMKFQETGKISEKEISELNEKINKNREKLMEKFPFFNHINI